ncbi:type II toxin-antitoxin system VapC family toxin [Rhizobium sp. RU20A]|uniref:type II toxin-antitoxin system VapC family toxin n=1 Tax=Rhizobium sp. RU20A TaxID=1907412 RepID=UPI00122CC02A|nr:type II toxin-antitoxin system VapC family toxin [Rhizobium sp. RU20A]
MLDTNVLSDAIRNPYGRSLAYMQKFARQAICTSAIVASEMRHGVAKKNASKLSARVEDLLGWIDVRPFDDAASRAYGHLRSSLERQGKVIGWGDLFIAAHALALGMTLVTANTREFARVDGLAIENWLEPAP